MHRSYPFAHRTNSDGAIDSICKTCFVTVGTAEEAPVLKLLEDGHRCDRWRLEFIKTFLSKARNNTQGE